MKTSHAYFINCAFSALDIPPTLDVPVLLHDIKGVCFDTTQSLDSLSFTVTKKPII